jgi:hypothetical protein
VLVSGAQTERNLVPYTNKVILNPSYAGLNENTTVWTGLQFFAHDERNVFNEYALTYDTYSQELKGGLAYYFRQGLAGDININTTELGISVSRHFEADRNFFIPSLNINAEFGSKQWYVQFIDQVLNKKFQPPSLPGNQFGRFYRLKPRLGFLWDNKNYQVGISAQFPLGSHLATEGEQPDLNNPVFILHLAKKVSGRRKGLVSRPFKATPEAEFLYSKNLVLSRLSLNVDEIKNSYALFLQNNFTENLHGVGGMYGFKFDNIRLNFCAGLSLPFLSESVAFYGEASLGIVIPSVFYSKKDPWAPLKSLY